MHPLTGDARELITAALAEAADQLDALQQEVATLEDTILQLQQFMQAGQALLGEPVAPAPALAVPSHLPTAAAKAQAMLEEIGRPMTLREMETYLHARGLLVGKSPLEALQSVLRKKTTVFWRVSRGVYGLQAWQGRR
jgi:hypothetical protein